MLRCIVRSWIEWNTASISTETATLLWFASILWLLCKKLTEQFSVFAHHIDRTRFRSHFSGFNRMFRGGLFSCFVRMYLRSVRIKHFDFLRSTTIRRGGRYTLFAIFRKSPATAANDRNDVTQMCFEWHACMSLSHTHAHSSELHEFFMCTLLTRCGRLPSIDSLFWNRIKSQ